MQVDPGKLKIIHYPDPRLRQPARPIEEVTPVIRDVARRMLDLMVQADGVGLAAPQVGLPWRMFVCNSTGSPNGNMVLINPRLTQMVGSMDSEEGCLSIPNVRGIVRRAAEVTIAAGDLDGRPIQMTGRELAARIWQHECDHLDGRLIIDRFSEADKIRVRRALRQLESEYRPARAAARR